MLPSSCGCSCDVIGSGIRLREELQQNLTFINGGKYRYISSTCLCILKHGILKLFPSRASDWPDFLSYNRHVPFFPAPAAFTYTRTSHPEHGGITFLRKVDLLQGVDTRNKKIVWSTTALWRPGNYQNSRFAHRNYSRVVPYETQNKQPLFRCHREQFVIETHVVFWQGGSDSKRFTRIWLFSLPAVKQTGASLETESWKSFNVPSHRCTFSRLFLISPVIQGGLLANGFRTYYCLMASVRLSLYVTEHLRSGNATSLSAQTFPCPRAAGCSPSQFVMLVRPSPSLLTRESDSFRATVQLRG